MAIVGQKPAPSRVDGFWVKQLGAKEVQEVKMKDQPITPKDVETLAQWGRTLMEAAQPAAEQRQKLQKQIEAERAALNKLEAAWAALSDEERKAVLSLGSDPAHAETVRYLCEQGFDGRKTAQASAAVRRYLEGLHTLAPAEVSRIMDLLRLYPLGVVAFPPPRPKTDPVKNSVQVIQEIH